MFLSWHSPDALAAAMPASILSFTLISIFMGTAGYSNTFIAQYMGAKRPWRVGPSMWQGIYIALLGGMVIAILSLAAKPIFEFIGHDPAVRRLEISYWRILTLGSVFPLLKIAVSSFFSGRGRTYPIMWANFASTLINIVLNYCLIFGNLGCPSMGIIGAGISTVISEMCGLLILASLIFRPKHESLFKTLSGFPINRELLLRLLRYGAPNGIQFFLDIAAFSAFILIVGRIGTSQLAATNIALNISMLGFMPMIGLGITVSVLVGQSLGANRPNMADRATISSLQISTVYMSSLAILFLVLPGIFIYPFAAGAEPFEFELIKSHAIVAVRFVAIWTLFDSVGIVTSACLKGAGDTSYVMKTIAILAIMVLVLPTYLAVEVLSLDLIAAWSIGVFYIIALGAAYGIRFKEGKWKSMRVIERE